MSTLEYGDKWKLEELLGMGSGYVLNHTYRSFANLIYECSGLDIMAEEYELKGTSKANRLRAFWETENDYAAGQVIQQLVTQAKASGRGEGTQLVDECLAISHRLLSGSPDLTHLTEIAEHFDSKHLQKEISRMEYSVEHDPDLAIGTAKELIETICKTILNERGISLGTNPDLSELTKATFKELKLTPEDIPAANKGADSIKRILSNLASVSNEINNLRNLYGTGHGKIANALGLDARHSKLVVGSSATLVRFLFESHQEQIDNQDS